MVVFNHEGHEDTKKFCTKRPSCLRDLRGYSIVLLAAVFLLAPVVRAAAQDSHILVVTGVAGDGGQAKQFHAWAR